MSISMSCKAPSIVTRFCAFLLSSDLFTATENRDCSQKNGPLKRALQKEWVFIFVDPGQGVRGLPGGPPEPSDWGLRESPGGLRDLRQTKAKTPRQKDLIEQWRNRDCSQKGVLVR
jgi:hypothetical protein